MAENKLSVGAMPSGQREAFQAALNGLPLKVSLGALVKTAVENFAGKPRVAFYLADDSGKTLSHVVGMSDAYARCVEGFKIGGDSLACGLAMHTGVPVITPDVTLDPNWQPWLWLAEGHDYRACWSFPMRTADGRGVGTFAIYFREPRHPTPRDFELADVLAQTAAVIISRHKVVAGRTRAEQALHEIEARLRKFASKSEKRADDKAK